MKREFIDFVASELKELESRDVDQLFECIRDNLMEMGLEMSESQDSDLFNEIEIQLNDLTADSNPAKQGR